MFERRVPTLRPRSVADTRRVQRWIIPAALFAIGLAIGANLDRIDPPTPPRAAVAAVPSQATSQLAFWTGLEYRNPGEGQACPDDALFVAVAGQSNAANTVSERFTARRAVYEWQDGKCFPAAGPLAGTDGWAGSYWPIVGDAVIASGRHKAVVFVGIAKSSTGVAQWANADDLGGYLEARLKQPARVDVILWHQGEHDIRMSQREYAARLRTVVATMRRAAPGAQIFIAQTSLCFGGMRSDAVLAAQHEVATSSGDQVHLGPNTDTLATDRQRFDTCHFSAQGARDVARLWAKALMQRQ